MSIKIQFNIFIRLILMCCIVVLHLQHLTHAADLEGYLGVKQVPNSVLILPVAPKLGSADFLRDQTIFQQMQQQTTPARWQQAIRDANLSKAQLGQAFSEAFGLEISAKNTPVLFKILQKIKLDNHDTTREAKRYYRRQRPFAFYDVAPCTPSEARQSKQNNAYPSGHTTLGWTYTLLLLQLRPERQNQLLKRGIDFGQSRVVCNMHWQSDVDAGRILGAALFARLQADPQFQADLRKAQSEIQQLLDRQAF